MHDGTQEKIVSCLDCRFWLRIDDQTGSCRATPPRHVLADLAGPQPNSIDTAHALRNAAAIWPITTAEDGCAGGQAGAQRTPPAAEIRLPHRKSDDEKIEAVRKKFDEGPFNPSKRAKEQVGLKKKILDWLAGRDGLAATKLEILQGVCGNPHSLITTLGNMKASGAVVLANGRYMLRKPATKAN